MTTPTDRLLTRAEVERRTGLGRSALYRAMREGRFPEPFRVGPAAVRWSEREIEAWVAALPRSRGDGIHRASKQDVPSAPHGSERHAQVATPHHQSQAFD